MIVSMREGVVLWLLGKWFEVMLMLKPTFQKVMACS